MIVEGVPQSSNIALDIDDAIQKSGNIGKFQVWSFFVIVFGMVSGAFFLYSLQYFEKIPTEFECKMTATSNWETCDQKTACEASTYSFRPDKNS